MTIARQAYVLLFCLIISTTAQAAEPAAFLGKPGCRIAPITPAPAGEVIWTGGCKDGYADGQGKLTWDVDGEGTRRLEAVLVRG